MTSFKDVHRRDWVITIDVAALKRVRAIAKVDLCQIGTHAVDAQLADPVTLVDAIYAICQPQAQKAGITDEQFGQGLAGDVIEQATAALLEAVIDFFPSARRPTLRAMRDKGEEIRAAAEKAILDKLKTLDPTAVIKELLEGRTPGASSTSAPESSGSTLAR